MKFIGFVTESNNFCRTHKCEIQRVEEKHQVFSLKVVETQLFELSIDNSSTFKIGRVLGDSRGVERGTGAKG